MTRRLPLIAALAGLAVIALALGVVLAHERVPVTGGNNEFEGGPHFAVDPGAELCQPLETIPAGTGAVRVRASAAAPTELRAVVRAGGRVVASGQGRWDGTPAPVDIRLDRTIPEDVTDATTCFEARGAAPVEYWAFGRGGRLSAYTGDFRFDMRVRLVYLGPEAESRAAGVGDTARRMATARASLLDGWAPWGALVAVLGALALVLVAIKRELTP